MRLLDHMTCHDNYLFTFSAPVKIRLPRSSSSVSKQSSYVPERARPSTTKDVFYYHSRQNKEHHGQPGKVYYFLLGLKYQLLSFSFNIIDMRVILSTSFC